MNNKFNQLRHDINSNLSSLLQALEIIVENHDKDVELVGKVSKLSLEKIKTVIKDWEEIKKELE